ncbi:type IV pilus modification PilV family protein [Marinobacterium sedimentorum]|uniref:type IV pilus modification PilV family protein n=1 Tax=Marinobacterium sedimentorum TaxID=2927804 RepID=UPI0020C6C935|nr:prepilin-type N-terminal cleavage/methylation domain-containing protein [Marinobacterium sedimentorum]MCP8688492.1 prepilin-type N-terminal cleavage/methylation domain-containing protein [Marinobacterium sedimentorum]
MKTLTRYPGLRYLRGFTLIEVLISLIVAVIGIVAILQLQGVFLSTASDSQQRALATAVAEKKLEELRGFDSIATTSSSLNSFDDIDNGTGTETVTAGSTSYTYNVAWTVTPYSVSGGVISAASAASADFKNVTLSVSWDSGASSLSLSSVIAAINPQVSKFIDKSGLGGSRPEVDHTPGGVPDVVPIDVGDGKARETSKPLPDVEQSNESTEVRFTTVTYDTTDYKQVDAEEFVTVNCFCVLNTTPTDGFTPYHHTFNGQTTGLDVAAGNIVDDVATGTPYTQGNFTQSNFCTRCCAQHHDSSNYDYATNGVPRYDNTVTSGAHKHYKFSPSPPTASTPTLAEAVNGDRYLEACRFRRVDGIFRLFPNWKMLDLNVMPYSYLTSSASSSLATYQQYVGDKVQDGIFASSVASSLTGRDFDTFPAAKTQVLSRGLYYDDMSYNSTWTDYMTNTVAASAALLSSKDWLQYVPFYEINMTLLTTWSTASTAVATVTSQNIDTVVDDATDYYGVYSRGRVTGGTTTSAATTITATSKTDNTGILGNTYANPSSYLGKDNRIIPSPGIKAASLAVTNLSTSSLVVLSGVISQTSTGIQLNKISVGISSGSCDVPVVTGSTASYNCYVVPSVGSVTISPTTTSNSAYLNPTVSIGNPAQVTGFTTGTSNGNDGTITLSVATSGVTGLDFNYKK